MSSPSEKIPLTVVGPRANHLPRLRLEVILKGMSPLGAGARDELHQDGPAGGRDVRTLHIAEPVVEPAKVVEKRFHPNLLFSLPRRVFCSVRYPF